MAEASSVSAAQGHLMPHRKYLYEMLLQRTIRLVIPKTGPVSAPFDAKAIAGRYAKLNPLSDVKGRELWEPVLSLAPSFSWEENKNFPFSYWMRPEKAKAGGYSLRSEESMITPKQKEAWIVGRKRGMVLANVPADYCSFFTGTSKMSCGSWSIPAGSSVVGGTCPSANAMFFVAKVDPALYEKSAALIADKAVALTKKTGTFPRVLPMVKEPIPTLADSRPVEGSTLPTRNICDACYAAKGNFGTDNIQLWQMARYAWAFESVKAGTFVKEMTAALTSFLGNKGLRKASGESDVFFRIHDSGDFFSPAYLMAWAEVCAGLPHVRFWAPTRVWPLWPKECTEAMKAAPNLTLRPSALQFNDPAPLLSGHPAAGSAAVMGHPVGALVPMKAGLASWDCPAYTFEVAKCANALNAKHVDFLTQKTYQKKLKESGKEKADLWLAERRAEDNVQKAYIAEARKHYKSLTGKNAPDDCRFCWDHPEHSVAYHAH